MHMILAQQIDLQQLQVCYVQNAGAHDQILACIACANVTAETGSSVLCAIVSTS